jgi:hypothetical protein
MGAHRPLLSIAGMRFANGCAFSASLTPDHPLRVRAAVGGCNRVGFNVAWKILVAREGRVSSTISLIPSTVSGKSASSAQQSRLLHDAPAQFGGLVRVLGPSGALTAIAELLAQ